MDKPLTHMVSLLEAEVRDSINLEQVNIIIHKQYHGVNKEINKHANIHIEHIQGRKRQASC